MGNCIGEEREERKRERRVEKEGGVRIEEGEGKGREMRNGYMCVHACKGVHAHRSQNCLWLRQSLLLTKHTILVTPIPSPCTHMCILSQHNTLSCGSKHLSWCDSGGGCTVGTLHLQPAPSPSSGTCVHAVTRQVVAESASAFLAVIVGS